MTNAPYPLELSVSPQQSVELSHHDSALATTLVLLTLSGGGTVFDCCAAIKSYGSEPLQHEFTLAVAGIESGHDIDSMLGVLADRLGPQLRPLMLTLRIVLATGVTSTAAIVELHRLEQRKQRNELSRRAQRLPTLLLAPMVGCFLPAFVLLTLIPILLVTLSGVFTMFPSSGPN